MRFQFYCAPALFLFSWGLSLALARAQSPQKALSWEDCVILASKNSPQLHAAEANLFSAQNQTLANRNGFFPQLSGSLGYSYANSPSLAAGFPTGPNTSYYNASLTASQNLFNGLSDLAKVREGRANEIIALSNLKTVRAQISYSLRTAFEALDFAKKSVKLSEEIIQRRQQNLRLVQLRFFHGVENKGSLLLYQAYLSDAKFYQMQTKDNLTEARGQLAQALGMDTDVDLDIKGTVPQSSPILESSWEQLASQVPSFEQSRAQIEFNDAALVLARSGFFPTLALTGTTGNTGNAWFPDTNRWSLGISLNVPLFNGGRDYYGTKAAAENKASSEKTSYATLLQNEVALRQAYYNFAESVEQFKVNQNYLEASKVRAEIARANYNNGLMSFQDWDLAENDLITRQKNVLNSEQSRVVTEAAWMQALGRGDIKGESK